MCGLRFAACAAGRLRCIETKKNVKICMNRSEAFCAFLSQIIECFCALAAKP